MESSSGGRTATTADTGRLRSRAERTDAGALWRVLRDADGLRLYWASPDGPRIAGGGIATELAVTSSGSGSNDGEVGDGDPPSGGEPPGSSRFATVERRAAALFRRAQLDGIPAVAQPRLVGGFAFAEEHAASAPWTGYPTARFVLPRTQVVVNDEAWVTRSVVGDAPPPRPARSDDGSSAESPGPIGDENGGTPPSDVGSPPGVESTHHDPDREEWRTGVQEAIAAIDDGDLKKVVLAGSLVIELAASADPLAVLQRLDRAHPSCTRFLIDPPDGPAFVGATPERLVSLDGRTVRSEVLAGSTGRGETEDEDAWLASDLAASQKDRTEHAIAVDAIRDALDPICNAVSVGERSVRRLSSVQHLRTPIRGRLAADRHVTDVVGRLHPTPAVGGAPRAAALDRIAATEPFDRGWYAGPIGWLDPAGDGTFALGIRSALLDGSRATCYAGAGIVADSDPDAEWDEVQLKYRAVLDALDAARRTDG